MHNLELTEDQTLILDTVRKFVQDSVSGVVLARDEHREFLRSELQGLAELGLFGLPVPESSGGVAMGLVPLVAACEEIGATSGSLACLLATQVQCALALAHAGGGPVEAVLAGSELAAFVGPEHAIALESGALRGKAELVPAAAEASLLVVAAEEHGQPVLCVVAAEKARRTALRSLGLASAAPARVEFDAVPAAPLATGEAAAAAIEAARIATLVGGAAAAVGMGRAAVALSRQHAAERIAFGKPLLAQQAVQRKIVDSTRALAAARHLTFHAARLADLGAPAIEAAMTARIAAVDAAVTAADEGIQIHGGYGYTVEYHVERHYRDAKTLEVLDGGSERFKDRLAAGLA